MPPPISGRATRVASWRFRLGRCDDILGWSVFVERGTVLYSSMKGKQFGALHVTTAVNRYFLKARKNPTGLGGEPSKLDGTMLETVREERMARKSIERGARCQVQSRVERIYFFLHTKS